MLSATVTIRLLGLTQKLSQTLLTLWSPCLGGQSFCHCCVSPNYKVQIFGLVLDINDVVTFIGQTVEEARQEFYKSVDDYLAFCQDLGEEPQKPFSGKLAFRTTPESHRKIFIAANKAGKSINAWMDEVLSIAADKGINANS